MQIPFYVRFYTIADPCLWDHIIKVAFPVYLSELKIQDANRIRVLHIGALFSYLVCARPVQGCNSNVWERHLQ